MAADFEYDIGLSFAGEDRKRVEDVLLELSRRNIRAFASMKKLPHAQPQPDPLRRP